MNPNNTSPKEVYFERALFFSWYCGLGDCTFCYMSVQKNKITDPKKARRRFESVFAEAIISKVLNWKIEFVSGGYDSYEFEELVFLIKGIYSITNQKQWLNLGTLTKDQLIAMKPYTQGYAGTIETVNWNLRKIVCPSKTMTPIYKSFEYCDEIGIDKSITIIIGLGETIDDVKHLIKFITENGIKRITFYALNPHKETPFKTSPSKEYYCEWIRKTRVALPDLEIIAGAWVDKTDYYSAMLLAGADHITKIPSIRQFNNEKLQAITKEIESTGVNFKSNLTKLPSIDWNAKVDNLDSNIFNSEMKEKIRKKLESYLKQMKKNQ